MPGVEDQETRTSEGLQDATRRFRRILRALAKKKLSANKRHDRIFRNLLKYVDVQLSRMLVRKPIPLDLMALITRDLIEVALWCQFITASNENLRQFDDEVGIDLMEMLKLVDPSGTEYPSLQASAKGLGVSGKSTRMEKTGKGDKFWFKLCSKMIHPTAWSINMLLSSAKADYYRLELGGYALSCAIRAVASLTGLLLPPYIKN
jgi:hypothetical protein